AWGISFADKYSAAALPLAALATIFVVEVPGTLRLRMLEAAHNWKRFRLLVMAGTLLGLGSGLVVGLMGGGVWALIVQPPLFGLPGAIDLFVGARFRPDFTWSWQRYRQTALFGFNRVGASALAKGRQLAEQVALTAAFSFATLGIFTRAMGLGTLATGRIGSI